MLWHEPPVGTRTTVSHTCSHDDREDFGELTGDWNPLHFHAAFGARTQVGRLIVQGGLTTGQFNSLVAMKLPGPGSVFLHQAWNDPAPVYIGDTVTAEAEVVDARTDKPITRLACVAPPRADGTDVLRGTCVVYTMQPEVSRG